MALGIEWRLGADGSQFLAEMGRAKSAMKDVGNVARNELSQKLKTVFTVTAIEEAIRRTAQWALEIEQTSKQLGISAEALQTLQVIASKTGTPQDAVTGMFENIAKARDQAIAGNTELLVSFQALGVTISDLQTMTKSDLFGKTLNGIPSNVQNADQFTRRNVSNVTGSTPENFINAVTSQVGPAGGFGAFQQQQKDEGTIVSEGTVNELAATWTQILETLKEAGTELKPLALLVLGIINTIVNAIAGVADMVSGIGDIFKGNFKMGLQKIFGVLINAIFGIAKIVTGLSDLAVGSVVKIASHIPGLKTLAKHMQEGKTSTEVLTDVQNMVNKSLGISDKVARHGEGVGETATIIGTGGASAAVRGASLLTKTVGLAGRAERLSGMANSLDKLNIFNKPIGSFAERTAEKFGKTKNIGMDEEMGSVTFGDSRNLYSKIFKSLIAVPALAVAGQATAKGIVGGKHPMEVKPILPLNSLMQDIPGGKQAMLSMGGTFGTGFQSRVIKLNEQMVAYLAQITKLMSFNPTQTGKPGDNPNTQPSGGN